jgi:hypothetical protein
LPRERSTRQAKRHEPLGPCPQVVLWARLAIAEARQLGCEDSARCLGWLYSVRSVIDQYVGERLEVVVTATNAGGKTSVASKLAGVVKK